MTLVRGVHRETRPAHPAAAADEDSAWRLWIDGTAAPNPGALGLGMVLEAPGGERHRAALRAAHGCNNTAELRALLQGLHLAWNAGARHLVIFSDSDFVVRHVLGMHRTRIAPLQALVNEARHALKAFDGVALRWIPRHRNGEADSLARSALGLSPKPATRPISRKRRR